MSKFKIGDEVVKVSDVSLHGEDASVLTVKDLTVTGKVITTNIWYPNNPRTYDESELILESEYLTQIKVLEAEFKKLKPIVNEKMKLLEKQFTEINTLIESAGVKFSDFDGAKSLVYKMIDAGGWSGSSFSC